MTNYDDRFVWVDIETTGLLPEKSLLLEVGVRITDVELNLIDEKDWQIWDSYGTQAYPSYDEYCGPNFEHLDQFIRDMHTKSGLLEDARHHGGTPKEVMAEVTEWINGYGVEKQREPMCGSSVQFDRLWLLHWMPTFHNQFHYRNIDISTIKELCRRLNPVLYGKIEQNTTHRELHRVSPDLEDTCSEARFYFENFLHMGV